MRSGARGNNASELPEAGEVKSAAIAMQLVKALRRHNSKLEWLARVSDMLISGHASTGGVTLCGSDRRDRAEHLHRTWQACLCTSDPQGYKAAGITTATRNGW